MVGLYVFHNTYTTIIMTCKQKKQNRDIGMYYNVWHNIIPYRSVCVTNHTGSNQSHFICSNHPTSVHLEEQSQNQPQFHWLLFLICCCTFLFFFLPKWRTLTALHLWPSVYVQKNNLKNLMVSLLANDETNFANSWIILSVEYNNL